MVVSSGAFARLGVSLAAGKGFVPFGTDDPMTRPFAAYPVNHHLAQILERYVAIAAVSAGPVIVEGKTGLAIEQRTMQRALEQVLTSGTRQPLQLLTKPVEPKVTRATFGQVIVIRRGGNSLNLYDSTNLVRSFGVATGQSRYPTPLGRWHVVVKWRNPWWYPPNSSWAKGEKPIPPGPGNPLGTRWMGLSASGVGIHGTPDDASIGYSASHGCIRMHIPDAEWLFNHVTIGTTVFIVSV